MFDPDSARSANADRLREGLREVDITQQFKYHIQTGLWGSDERPDLKAPFVARRCKFRWRSQRAGRSRTPTVVHVLPGGPVCFSPQLRPSFP